MNNSTSIEALNAASLRTLGQQLPNFICWVIFPTIGFITNTLVTATIACTKSLYNKSHFLIMCHSVAEVLSMAAYLELGLRKCISYALSVPETTSRFWCATRQFPLVLSTMALQSFSLILAIDRFVCMAFPVFYRTRNMYRYVSVFVSIVVANGLLKVYLAFGREFFDDQTLLPVCNYATSFDRFFVSFLTIESDVVIPATVLLYTVAGCILFRRYKSTTFVGETQKKEWRRKMDLDVFVALMAIGAIYVSGIGFATLLTTVATRIATVEAIMLLSPFVSLCMFLSSISHLFVYLKVNKAFRESFRSRILRRGVTDVTDVRNVRST